LIQYQEAAEYNPEPDQTPQNQSNAANASGTSIYVGGDAETESLSHCDCCKCQLRAKHNWANISDIDEELGSEIVTSSEVRFIFRYKK